jgi:hypothetical protein
MGSNCDVIWDNIVVIKGVDNDDISQISHRGQQGAVSGVLDGSEGIIYNTDEIVDFLDAYAKKAPPALKMLAKIVKWDMLRKKRRKELFLGFRLK